jgi:hypothetical protein
MGGDQGGIRRMAARWFKNNEASFRIVRISRSKHGADSGS